MSERVKIFVFSAKVGGLVLVVALVHIALEKTLKRNPAAAIEVAQGYIKKHSDVLMFGDSVTYNTCDLCSTSLGELTVEALKPTTVTTATGSGYPIEVYYSFSRYFAAKAYQPKWFIVPLNLRSFSGDWDTRPNLQFVKRRAELAMGEWPLVDALIGPFFILRGVELSPISKSAWLDKEVKDGDRVVGKVREYAHQVVDPANDQEVARHFLFSYLGAITPQHRKVETLSKLALLHRKMGSRTLFYVTPIDYETGRRHFGPRFVDQVKANVAILKDATRAAHSEFLDLSTSLGSEQFAWRQEQFVNEHMSQQGIEQISKVLAGFIQGNAIPARAISSDVRK